MSNPDFDRAYAEPIELFPSDPPPDKTWEPVRDEEMEREAAWTYLVADMRDFVKEYGVRSLLHVVGEALSNQPELFK
jgi:hypothetical protein